MCSKELCFRTPLCRHTYGTIERLNSAIWLDTELLYHSAALTVSAVERYRAGRGNRVKNSHEVSFLLKVYFKLSKERSLHVCLSPTVQIAAIKANVTVGTGHREFNTEKMMIHYS